MTGRRHSRPVTSRLIYTACVWKCPHRSPRSSLHGKSQRPRLIITLHACRVPPKSASGAHAQQQVAGWDLWTCRLWWGAVARPRQAGCGSRGRPHRDPAGVSGSWSSRGVRLLRMPTPWCSIVDQTRSGLSACLCQQRCSCVSRMTPPRTRAVRDGRRWNTLDPLQHIGTMLPQKGSLTCEFCGELFQRREHLSRHRLRHSGLRPFRCTACAKSFSRR